MGRPSASMVNGSWLGVTTAANTNTRKISGRRQERSLAVLTIPARFSIMTSSGTSNDSPKISSIAWT
ncbi:hypothetical protein BMG523Draft_02066 [Frankia sp. BMG5.23]|nr:hypothetical protein BMG523Draft_02066 [Frankia sp. BMG5.23]